MGTRTYAIAHLFIAAAIAGNALLLPVLWPLLLWMSIAFAGMGIAYALNRPSVLGKRADGSRHIIALLLFLPYLAYSSLVLQFTTRLDRRKSWHRLVPGVRIGRRLHGFESTADTLASILDLTAELHEPRPCRSGVTYHCVPLLDAAPPSAADIERCVAALQALPRPVFIHCAQGSGRTSVIAAAFLVATQQCEDIQAALETVEAARPGAHPSCTQRTALLAWAQSAEKDP